MVWLDFFVCFYFGVFGVHKFREKKIGLGILYFFTCGLIGLGWLIDCIRYFIAAVKGQRVIYNKQTKKRHSKSTTDSASILTTCMNCGAVLPPNNRYCPQCGTAKYKEPPVFQNIWFWIIIVVTVLGFVASFTTNNTRGDYISSSTSNSTAINTTTVSTSKEEVQKTTVAVLSWKDGMTSELISEIENAFLEIGENPKYIESIDYVSTNLASTYDRKDYKVTFQNDKISNLFSPETWVHSRYYRITTEEWHTDTPERVLYPHERIVSIKFWTDDDSTNINQWAQNGAGKLQSPDATSASTANRDNINVSYVITADELVSEINKDKQKAAEKYNGQWIEITGTVTYVSDGGTMVGYYLYGERGNNGLNITCWVDNHDNTNLSVGDTVTFIGVVREVTTVNNTEIGLCVIKD